MTTSFRGSASSAGAPRWAPLFGYAALSLASGLALDAAGSAGAPGPRAAVVFLCVYLMCVAAERACVCLTVALMRWRVARGAGAYTLQVDAHGVSAQTPGAQLRVDANALLGVHVDTRAARPRLHLVAVHDDGRASDTLPAVFGSEGAPLATLRPLCRERAAAPAGPSTSAGGADVVYAAAALGDVAPGCVAIRHGSGWLVGTPLGGFAVAAAALAASSVVGPASSAVWPLRVLALLAFAFPLWWLVAERQHEMAPRRGLSLLLTPSALIYRNGAFATEVPWSAVRGTRIESHPWWSVLRGAHARRTLVWQLSGQPELRYVETFLGVPAEVVQIWTEHFRAAH